MSGNSRSAASEKFANESLDRSKRAFGLGLGWAKQGQGMVRDVFANNGEPAYLGRAIEGATANAQDSALLGDQMEQIQAVLGNKGAVSGGNFRRAFNPESAGAKLASIVMGSGVQRQNARISQMFDAAGLGIGQASNAGDLQAHALSNQLGAIAYRPTVDPTYAAAVGLANAGFTAYGAAQKYGANKPPADSTGLGQLASNSWTSPTAGVQGVGWGGNPGVSINWGSMPFNTIGRR